MKHLEIEKLLGLEAGTIPIPRNPHEYQWTVDVVRDPIKNITCGHYHRSGWWEGNYSSYEHVLVVTKDNTVWWQMASEEYDSSYTPGEDLNACPFPVDSWNAIIQVYWNESTLEAALRCNLFADINVSEFRAKIIEKLNDSNLDTLFKVSWLLGI